MAVQTAAYEGILLKTACIPTLLEGNPFEPHKDYILHEVQSDVFCRLGSCCTSSSTGSSVTRGHRPLGELLQKGLRENAGAEGLAPELHHVRSA